ncbi:MAG: hypothetical protein HY730_02010 [Candidatus Tectomicrobia bacterium]|uniref:Uncharacterized protein n=1 Tax=Tectimicrobiota bacterium TaxID=2528274 RepID=A0A933GJR3_UNCTE|nr:hypothetical protein [Candidatus Tectomicrobia bacterium]
MFTGTDPSCGIDFDHCRNPETGEVEPWAMEIILRFGSYCEISPSQTGVKFWVRGTLPGPGHKKGNIEIYDQGRYFTVTGHTLEGFETIRDRDEILKEFYYETFGTSQRKEESSKNNGQGDNGFHWDGDIETLPIKVETKRLIREGALVGQRSEAIMTVLNALVWAISLTGKFTRFL